MFSEHKHPSIWVVDEQVEDQLENVVNCKNPIINETSSLFLTINIVIVAYNLFSEGLPLHDCLANAWDEFRLGDLPWLRLERYFPAISSEICRLCVIEVSVQSWNCHFLAQKCPINGFVNVYPLHVSETPNIRHGNRGYHMLQYMYYWIWSYWSTWWGAQLFF
jgi:hypothetical protein